MHLHRHELHKLKSHKGNFGAGIGDLFRKEGLARQMVKNVMSHPEVHSEITKQADRIVDRAMAKAVDVAPKLIPSKNADLIGSASKSFVSGLLAKAQGHGMKGKGLQVL